MGNGDVITAQIANWMTAQNITDLVIVTHSGGSNQARYIMNNATRNSNYTKVYNATKRVITLAAPTKGTYLANEVFQPGDPVSAVLAFGASIFGFGGEGTNFIRTNYISTYNSSSSYLGAIANPVNSRNFYSGGGEAATIGCVGVKVWGVCVGVSNVRSLDNASTPLSACDSVVDDTGLLILHDNYLDANDSSTARSTPNASDGFINLLSSQALGNDFTFPVQDHNESRRQCNGTDVAVRNYVNSSESGFALNTGVSQSVNPHQIDACGFGDYACITSGGDTRGHSGCSNAVAWTEGCTASQLGNGNCDWDCVALYGQDSNVTQWDSTGTIPLQWGTTNDCTATQGSYSGLASTTLPFGEIGTYTNTSGGTVYNTAFNGATCTGTSAQCGGYSTSTTWFEDPNYNSTGTLSIYSAGYCPQSWINDGTCDECVIANYGADGDDCLPGHITQCGGIVTAAQPYTGSNYYYYNNSVYNEGTPSSGGKNWLEWQAMSASAGDGVCENTECAQGTAAALPPAGANAPDSTGKMPCTSGAQCPGELNCSSGYCTSCTNNSNNAAGSCNSSTYGWSGNTCNTSTGICYQTATLTAACNSNSDCLSGTCSNGGCTTAASDCTTSYPAPASTYSCGQNSDCTEYGGTCTSGYCTGTITTSLCK
jgi:hypothetical protein